MDWLSPVSGLVGALVGAGAGYAGSRQVLNRQLEDTKQAREQAERIAVVAALSTVLTALLEHAARIPDDPARRGEGFDQETYQRMRAKEKEWDEGWQPLVRTAHVAALEVRDADVRNRLTTGLRYLKDWNALEYAFHGKIRAWVLAGVLDHLVETVFAWRREEELPAPIDRFTSVAEAWALKMEEYEDTARAEAEDTD
ncbi:hypothetical protein [Streptomyces sp. NBC_00280]|uniref:hypothetical protein n=1 Tax=Streptomyces sp. NBC_00280 TaxID=2975699 RepID=UPI002F91614A